MSFSGCLQVPHFIDYTILEFNSKIVFLLVQAQEELRLLAGQFRAVAVVGPRQSGKTTLVRMTFPDKEYVSLENPDTRNFALEDPRGFLAGFSDGAILDENAICGRFILTGSNNFLLQENISQSLAGRVGYLFLLPLSLGELPNSDLPVNDLLYKGFYPALHNDETEAETSRYFANYIRTYVERDVRLIRNITNLTSFECFLRLCAGRIGQLLNMSNLAVETGVDNKTIAAWLSVLEASFIVFRLQPYHKNFNKRIVKIPKLYFYDTGLASALLGIENANQLKLHPLRGALFENMIVVDFLKNRYNQGKLSNLYFWRDSLGREVDLLLENQDGLVPIEIKSGQTITNDYFGSLTEWLKISGEEKGWIIYAGDSKQVRSSGITVVPYREAAGQI